MQFCLSALLSALVSATQILFRVSRVHGLGGSMLMRATIPMLSAEAVWQGLKLLGLGSCVVSHNSSSRTFPSTCKADVHSLQTTGMHNACAPWTACKDRHLIACSVRVGVWSYVYRMNDLI